MAPGRRVGGAGLTPLILTLGDPNLCGGIRAEPKALASVRDIARRVVA